MIPWWAWLWIGLISVWSAAGAADDVEQGRSKAYAAMGVATGLWSALAVAAYFFEPLKLTLGRGLLPVTIIAAVWLLIETVNDWSSAEPPKAFSPMVARVVTVVGTGLSGVIFGGALWLGVRAGLPAW